MKESYLVGINIGPIYNTLKYAKTFKDLWATSLLFSEISRNLLRRIYTQEFFEVLSPIVIDENELNSCSLVNKYDDKIIVMVSGKNKLKIDKWIKENIEETFIELALDKMIENYFKIEYVILPNDTSLQTLSKCLEEAGGNVENNLTEAEFEKIMLEFSHIIKNNKLSYKILEEKNFFINPDKNMPTLEMKDYLLLYYDGNDVSKALEKTYYESKEKYFLASKALTCFSRNVATIVESKKKNVIIPIYIVGDDGCFLIPTKGTEICDNEVIIQFIDRVIIAYNRTLGKVIPGMSLRFSINYGSSYNSNQELFQSTYTALEEMKLLANFQKSNDNKTYILIDSNGDVEDRKQLITHENIFLDKDTPKTAGD